MAFFIPSNTFLRVVKLHVFRKKILGILGDALSQEMIEGFGCEAPIFVQPPTHIILFPFIQTDPIQ